LTYGIVVLRYTRWVVIGTSWRWRGLRPQT
jgi:hypothetical protein